MRLYISNELKAEAYAYWKELRKHCEDIPNFYDWLRELIRKGLKRDWLERYDGWT